MSVTAQTSSTDIGILAWSQAIEVCRAAGIAELLVVDDLGNEFPVDELSLAYAEAQASLTAERDRLRKEEQRRHFAALDAEKARSVAARKRRKFGQAVLARYPLTQPPYVCQRCGWIDLAGPLELDHMLEIHLGGIDHPHNLIRLCSACHRAKPYLPQLTSLVQARLAIITWAHARPNLRWWDVDELARYRELAALVRA